MKITAEINIETLADMIANLNDKAKAKLLYLLETRDDKELLGRKKQVDNGTAKFLTREQVFDL